MAGMGGGLLTNTRGCLNGRPPCLQIKWESRVERKRLNSNARLNIVNG